MCCQLHVRELQIHDSCNAEKQKLVKRQLTLFDERASSDTDNLSKSWRRRLLWIL